MKELTQEEQLAIQTVRSFVKNELAPMAKKIDEDDIFPLETVRKLGELGLMGMFVPNEWEGAGLSHYLYALAIEEISSASAAVGTIVSAHSSLAVWPILKFGTDAQKKRFLPPMAKGEAIGCFCLTEPEAGSDAANLKTSYRHASDGYTISGAKAFITNASRAKTGIVFATKDRSLRHRGISTFLLDMETPGVLVGKPEKKLGIHGADSCPAKREMGLGSRWRPLMAEGSGLPPRLWGSQKERSSVQRPTPGPGHSLASQLLSSRRSDGCLPTC